MAPGRATRKQAAREADYSNIGVAGRKTGITLKDSGVRDEHGLEPIDGIFSSPERPQTTGKTNGTNVTITEEVSMEIGQSTIPEPADVLTNRRINLPPPRSRSPMKTNIGSSPRRSVGPPSSPSKPAGRDVNGDSSIRSSPRPVRPSPLRSVGRMSRDPDESIAAISPAKSAKRRKAPDTGVAEGESNANGAKRRKVSAKGAKDIFDVNVTDEEGDTIAGETADSSRLDNGDVVEAADDSLPVDVSENMALEESTMEQIQEAEAAVEVDPKEVDESTIEAEVEAEATTKRKAGRPKRPDVPKKADTQKKAKANIAASTKPTTVDHQEKPVAAKGRRGRPPKNTTLATEEPAASIEQESGVADERPAKKEKKPAAKAAPSKSAAIRKKPPPSQRSREARVSSGADNKRAAAAAIDNRPSAESSATAAAREKERSKPRPRGLLMLRSETPAEDEGAQILRSGRTSVKPLAYWRSEKIIYGEARKEGNRLSLPGIKEVIRTEEMMPPPSRRGRGGRRGPKPGRRRAEPDIKEEDEDAEEWELDTGIVCGEVMQWDPVEERGTEHYLEEIDLAYAPKGMQGLIREVKNATFLYGKTVTLPFFHSGIVDLPPQAEKRLKNSRKNHMVFHVFSGRVDVNVSNNEFSVGAGGMWQVPRGNFYSLQNPYSKPSRVFFAQGCYMDGKEELERVETGGEGEGQAAMADAAAIGVSAGAGVGPETAGGGGNGLGE